MAEKLGEREKLLSQEWQSLMEVVNFYLDVADKDFIQGLDQESAVGYVYGRLLHDGYDPDEVLEASGVTAHEV